MDKIIAKCGLICSECEAFQATQKDDAKALAEVAAKWTKLYNHDFTAESVVCDGCQAVEGRLSVYAREVCGIRQCCVERRIGNCYYCEVYPCEMLEKFFELVPEARSNLE